MIHEVRALFAPLAEPRNRHLLLLLTAAVVAMLLGERNMPTKIPLLRSGWCVAVYGMLPLAVAIALDARRPAGRWLALAAGLVALAPIAAWIAAPGMRGALRSSPELTVAAGIVGLGIALLAARAGEVALGEWSAGPGDWRWWAPRTAALAGVAVGIAAVGAALDPALRAAYPKWEAAREDPGMLLLVIGATGLYLVPWEFFYRGFLLRGVARHSGVFLAVLFQAVIFFLLHRRSAQSEMLSSFFGGAALAGFCWRARSFWPGVVLHWALNTAMQVIGYFW